MGKMVAYNFDDAFNTAQQNPNKNLSIEEKNIDADSFLTTETYHNFLEHKRLREKVKHAIQHKSFVNEEDLNLIIAFNKNLYLSYECVGDYYYYLKKNTKAKEFFTKALSLKIPTIFEQNRIEKKLKKC
jgi:Tfp pilus assembly protein PilF